MSNILNIFDGATSQIFFNHSKESINDISLNYFLCSQDDILQYFVNRNFSTFGYDECIDYLCMLRIKEFLGKSRLETSEELLRKIKDLTKANKNMFFESIREEAVLDGILKSQLSKAFFKRLSETEFVKKVDVSLIEYIISKFPRYAMNNFAYLKAYYNENPILYSKLLTKENVVSCCNNHNIVFLVKVIEKVYNDKIDNQLLCNVCGYLVKEVEEQFEAAKDSIEVLSLLEIAKKISALFLKIRSEQKADFGILVKTIKDKASIFLNKNGIEYEEKISCENFVKLYEISTEVLIKQLSSTHIEYNGLVPFVSIFVEPKKKSFWEKIMPKEFIDEPSNENYSFSQIKFYRDFKIQMALFYKYIIETNKSSFKYCQCGYLSEVIKITLGTKYQKEIEDDLVVLWYHFESILIVADRHELVSNAINHSFVAFTICLIEKLLRYFVQYEKNNVGESLSRETLGDMLKDKNLMEKILDPSVLKYLTYFLSTDSDKKNVIVGKDYRNKIFHYHGIQLSEFNYSLSLEVMYSFNLIVNSLVVKYYIDFNNEPKNKAK